MKVLALRSLGADLPPLKEGQVGEIDDEIGLQLLARKRPPIQVIEQEVKPKPIPAPEPVQAEDVKASPAVTSKKPKS